METAMTYELSVIIHCALRCTWRVKYRDIYGELTRQACTFIFGSPARAQSARTISMGGKIEGGEKRVGTGGR